MTKEDADMDEELKKAHQALRRVWTARAPPFVGLLKKARASSVRDRAPDRVPLREKLHVRRWRWATATALATAILLAVALLARRPGEAERFEALLAKTQEETRLGYWEGPTEFLLDIPGQRLTSHVPKITWPDTWLETGPYLEDLTRNGSEP